MHSAIVHTCIGSIPIIVLEVLEIPTEPEGTNKQAAGSMATLRVKLKTDKEP